MTTSELTPLRSPCCNAPLYVTLRTEGPAYVTYEVADQFNCSGKNCYNTWDAVTGEPDSYNKEK